MRYSSRTFISLLVIAGLLSGVVLVAPPAAAVSTTTWTTTADFDAGTKELAVLPTHELLPLLEQVSTLPLPAGTTIVSSQTASYWDGASLHVWQSSSTAGSNAEDDIYYTKTEDFTTWSTPVLVISNPDGAGKGT